MRQKNLAHALHRKTDGGDKDSDGHDGRGDRLRFSVAVGMRCVRRARGEFQSAPNHDRTADVESRFDSVRDQDIGISENAGGDLGDREDHDSRSCRAGRRARRFANCWRERSM